MGKFLVKDKLAEIPVSNDQNTCLLPGDCQDILIGKTSRMIARDCVRGKKVLFFASKLREPVKTEKSGLEDNVDVVVIRLASLTRLNTAIRSYFVVQPFHPLCQKPLHPLVDKAAADANRLRNIRDRHPLSEK
jgi:hypothetical protein